MQTGGSGKNGSYFWIFRSTINSSIRPLYEKEDNRLENKEAMGKT